MTIAGEELLRQQAEENWSVQLVFCFLTLLCVNTYWELCC